MNKLNLFTLRAKQVIVILLLGIFLFNAAQLTAQDKKKKNVKKTTKTFVPPVIDSKEEVVTDELVSVESIDAPSHTETAKNDYEPLSNIRFNDKYERYTSINDNYDLYYPKYSNDKYSSYGIVDKSGNVILPFLFKYERAFNNSEVVLRLGNNIGLYNVNEKRWTIPMFYDGLTSLGNNLFSAKRDGKWGVIDNNNKIVVSFQWTEINSINYLDNYIYVTDNSYPNSLMGIYSFVDHKLTVPCIYKYITKSSNQNYFVVTLGSQKNIIDINNNPRFKKWYDEITLPSKGRNYFIIKSDNRYGVIDENENVIIPTDYIEFASYPFSDGSYLARNKEGKYGFILIDGRITLPFVYDNLIKNYSDNIVTMQNGKCGLVQVNAGLPYEIVTCDYDSIKMGSKAFIVEKDGKFGLMDVYGKLIGSTNYDSLGIIADNSYDGTLYIAKKDGICMLLNDGGTCITTEKYVDISSIQKKSDSYYSPKFSYLKAKTKNGKYCIIDKVGKLITKTTFDDVLTENDNLVIAVFNKKYGLFSILDQKNLINFEYDLIIKTTNNYVGFIGNKMEILVNNSNGVTKYPTILDK
jgi:hypothetical protein